MRGHFYDRSDQYPDSFSPQDTLNNLVESSHQKILETPFFTAFQLR
jgi:hypothetical protein